MVKTRRHDIQHNDTQRNETNRLTGAMQTNQLPGTLEADPLTGALETDPLTFSITMLCIMLNTIMPSVVAPKTVMYRISKCIWIFSISILHK